MRLAKTAILKAGESAFRDRKRKKRLNRQLHNIRINAAVRPLGTSYSVFIDQLKKYGSTLDRKSLSELARNYPAVFQKIVETVKK
jgi:large subunit ribosomal protein L20